MNLKFKGNKHEDASVISTKKMPPDTSQMEMKY